MNADAIRHALRQKFPAQEYALFFEVRSATGFPGRLRSADALAMSLWPSRGLELHGFEIKVSLQKVLTDFERESGLHVNEYSGPRMANAVRLLQNGGAERLRAEALRAIQEIKSATLEAERELQGEKP